MLIDSLQKMADVAWSEFKISVDHENPVDLKEMSNTFANGVISLFAKDKDHHRPIWGPNFRFKDDPHWKDYIHFYEFYNPETGQGLGASHQSGWSSLVANLISDFRA